MFMKSLPGVGASKVVTNRVLLLEAFNFNEGRHYKQINKIPWDSDEFYEENWMNTETRECVKT